MKRYPIISQIGTNEKRKNDFSFFERPKRKEYPMIPKPLTQVQLENAIAFFTMKRVEVGVTTIGKSILGRPLWCLTLGQGTPRVMYVATHHAMEWICGWCLLDFARRYIEKSRENKAPLGTFYIIPLLNPDGVELQSGGYDPKGILATRQRAYNGGSEDFSHWQANARGVDLNHNYPTGFYAYREIENQLGIQDGAPTRYSGVAPLSEPETAALVNAIRILNPEGILTLHTQGRELYTGGVKEGRTARIATLLSRRTGYTYTTPVGAAAYGGLTDYMSEVGIPCLTLECGLGQNPLPANCFSTLVEEVFPFLYHFPRLLYL